MLGHVHDPKPTGLIRFAARKQMQADASRHRPIAAPKLFMLRIISPTVTDEGQAEAPGPWASLPEHVPPRRRKPAGLEPGWSRAGGNRDFFEVLPGCGCVGFEGLKVPQNLGQVAL